MMLGKEVTTLTSQARIMTLYIFRKVRRNILHFNVATKFLHAQMFQRFA